MKKLIMAVAILGAFTVSAQRHGGKYFTKNLSSEEVATLKTKKMTLALALDKKQSSKVYTILLDQVKNRKAKAANRKQKGKKIELTKEQRFEKMNKRLDKRIAIQNEMKTILTDAQFEQYKNYQKHNRKKGDKRASRNTRK